MPTVNLSADFCRKAICPEGKNKIDYRDKTIKGFLLEVRSSGNKTYALRYRDTHNRQCQYKLGNYGDLTFERARKAAEIARGKVVLNLDPSEEKRVKKKVPTLSYFVEFHYLPFIKKDKKSWATDASYLKCHILPKLGKYHMDKITSQAVSNFHQSMKANGYKPSMSNRGVKLLRYIYNVALSMNTPGIVSNPASGVKFFAEASRERYLTADETKRLLDAAEQSRNPQMKNIISLLILTGLRKNELLQADWGQISFERKSFHIPMSKSGKSRNVPLSEAALDVLVQLPRWEGCSCVVPNPDTLKPFVQIHRAWDNVRKAAGVDARLHDLRHTFASNMANSNVSLYHISKILGHHSLKMTARYSHLSQETLLQAVNTAAEATGTDWGRAQME